MLSGDKLYFRAQCIVSAIAFFTAIFAFGVFFPDINMLVSMLPAAICALGVFGLAVASEYTVRRYLHEDDKGTNAQLPLEHILRALALELLWLLDKCLIVWVVLRMARGKIATSSLDTIMVICFSLITISHAVTITETFVVAALQQRGRNRNKDKEKKGKESSNE